MPDGYARNLYNATLAQLESDPSYQNLDPKSQRNARASLLQSLYRTDPQYAGDAESGVLYQEGLQRAPIVEGKPFTAGTYNPQGSVIKEGGRFLSGVDPLAYAKEVIGGLQNKETRASAIGDARAFLLNQKATDNNFMAELATKGYDFLADLWGDNREYFVNNYGSRAKLAASLIEDSLRQVDPGAAESAIATGGTLGGINRFLGEDGIAIASLGGGLGNLTGKGMASFLAKRGASAKVMALLGRAGTEVGEGLGFGVYNIVRDVARERLGTGESLGAKWDERIGKIAASFGTGMAMDAAFGILMGLVKTGFDVTKTIYRRPPTGFEDITSAITGADDIEVASQALREGLKAADVSPGIYQSLPEGSYKKTLAALDDIGKVVDRVKKIDPTSYEGAVTTALATGFHLKQVSEGFEMTSLLDPSITKTFPSINKALSWAGDLWKDSNPASQQAVKAAQGAARASTIENSLTIESRGFLRPEDLAEGEATKLLVPTSTGSVDARNVAGYARWFLKQAGATEPQIAGFSVTQGTKSSVLENGVVVPKIVGDGAEESEFLSAVRDSLDKYAKGLGLKGSANQGAGLLKLIEKPDLDTLRPRTLQYVVKEFLGGDLVIGSKGVSINFLDGTKLTYPTLEAANGAVFKNLVASGSIDFPELSRLMKETYGYNLVEQPLKVAGVAQGTQVGVLSDSGKLIAKAASLPELFETRPELVPKLPNRYAPELLFVDDNLTTIQTTRKAAAGSTALIRDMIKDFRGGWKPGKRIASAEGGSLYLSASGKQVFVVESPFGSRQKFINSKTAGKVLKENALNWETLQAEASSRGMRAFPVASKGGGFLLTDGAQLNFRARTLDEAAAFIKKQARPDDFPDALGLSDSVVDDLEDGWLDNIRSNGGYKTLERGNTWYEHGVAFKQTKTGVVATPKGDYLLPLAGEWVFPTETTFSAYAKRTGDDSVIKAFRLVENSRNITDIAGRKVQAIAKAALSDSRGRLLSGKKMAFVAELLSLPENRWSAFASETGRTLDTTIYRATRLTREAFNTLGERFGVDASRWLGEYAPKLQAVLQGGKYQPTLDGLKQASKDLFGNIPKEVEFFSMNFRSGLVIDSLLGEKNAYNLLMAYGVQGNKSLYIGPIWEQLWDASEALKKAGSNGAVPPGLQNRWEAYLDDVVGTVPAGIDRWHRDISVALTSKIADIQEAALKKLSKAPGVGRLAQDALESGSTRNTVTTDILGKLGARLTLNTQGWRPFVALRNTLDIQRAGAVLGNGLVLDALEEVSKEPEAIGQYLRTGVIEDTLFTLTAAEDIAQKKWKELATRGLLGSDLITRAATARAADKAFDTGLHRLASKKWTWKQFFSKTGFGILAPDVKQSIVEAVTSGNVAGARFLAAKGMVDKTMFTFRSGTGNLLTRHLIGKAFGKFQNYSFGMIELYRSILSSGSLAERALMTAKMAGNAFAVYYAAKAIGIDYNGFLPQDGIGVSGGPYWRAAYAALDAGKQGVRGSLARSELLRTFLITAYPESVVKGIIEGMDLAAKGRNRDAFLRMVLGAPVKKDF